MEKVIELYVKASDRLARRAKGERGQGVIEYVGIVVVVAIIIAAVILAADSFEVGDMIMSAIQSIIEGITGKIPGA